MTSETRTSSPPVAASAGSTRPLSLPPPSREVGLFDRTLGNLRTVWRDIASSALGVVDTLRTGGRSEDEHWRDQIRDCLEARGGEVSARARAADLGRTYLGLDAEGRARFLRLLAADFDVDRAAVDRAVRVFNQAADPVARGEAERALRRVLEPGRLKLLTQFNTLPEGVKFLVEMRAELLDLSRSAPPADTPLYAALEADLKGLLAGWFDVGFLDLRRITWDSPASLLEKLIRYEAVHAIRGWQDLKDRLDSDRRCFGFFHPRMPDEPLIFVEVALVRGLADSVQVLLDAEAPPIDPATADTAIFYSISNAQKGLAGISFGNFLIKRVVDLLQGEFGNLRQFATLSPIPGFRRWLEREVQSQGDLMLAAGEGERLAGVVSEPDRFLLAAALDGFADDPARQELLRPILMRLAATYLLTARKGPRAADPVAHFHLSNGARVERLNWMADASPKGNAESYGMMVNYAYRLASIDVNHESYRGESKITSSAAMRSLLKASA